MKILIAVDTSAAAQEATLVTKRLFPNAQHLIISAASIAPYIVTDPFGGGAIAINRSMDALNTSEVLADEALQTAQRVVGKSTADSVELGDAGQVICEQAIEHGADIIVVGRSSRNWF